MLKVEMNPYYAPGVMVLQCGSEAYSQLRRDGGYMREIKEELEGDILRRRWYIRCRQGKEPRWIGIRNGAWGLFTGYSHCTFFSSYLEALSIVRLLFDEDVTDIEIVEKICR